MQNKTVVEQVEEDLYIALRKRYDDTQEVFFKLTSVHPDNAEVAIIVKELHHLDTILDVIRYKMMYREKVYREYESEMSAMHLYEKTKYRVENQSNGIFKIITEK